MGTIRVKSAEVVRKFAEIKALVQETGNRVVVEEYNRPVLAIYPCDEEGNPLLSDKAIEAAEVEKLKQRLSSKKIKVSKVDFD